VATAAPAPPTQAKLIPIVSTAEVGDAVTLARLYSARWPQQENIIRDWLLPLGLDTNHGYARTAVEHAEVAKQRAALSQRRDTLVRWTDGARQHGRRASARYHKRWKHLKERGDALYRVLNAHISKLGQQGVSPELCRMESKAMQRLADAEPLELRYGMERALRESNDEHRKLERYCREQQIVWERDSVRVTFRPFNDRQLNRDLRDICQRVMVAAPHLPDGRRLLVTIGAAHRLSLDVSPQ
jgi:hypothetical protein